MARTSQPASAAKQKLKSDTAPILDHVVDSFARLANAELAIGMAAYMKTDMRFYGIQKPDRIPIYRELKKSFAPKSQREYESNVRALWAHSHREVKYASIEYASAFPQYVNASSVPLYEQMVRSGAWWDFVDPLAINLIGHAFRAERPTIEKTILRYRDDDDMWIRRTSLICQNHHKEETDETLLFETCLHLAHEKEFFIRKAIGWALREYSYRAPNAVRKFLAKNKTKLSPLSYNEGAKALIRKGLMD